MAHGGPCGARVSTWDSVRHVSNLFFCYLWLAPHLRFRGWSDLKFKEGVMLEFFLFKGDAHAWSAWPMPWHLNLMPLILCVVSMQAVQNLGMAVVTMLAGQIVDGQGYLVLEVFFLGWLCRESLFTTRNQLRMFSNSKITLYELQWLWWQLFWFGWWTPVKEVCSTCQSLSVTNTSGSKCKFLKWCQRSHFFKNFLVKKKDEREFGKRKVFRIRFHVGCDALWFAAAAFRFRHEKPLLVSYRC